MSADDNEEIAIVGIGCRFPGANDIHEFWRVLENAENHVCDIPKDRWNHDKFYSDDPDEAGKIYVSKAGLLSEHDKWDNRLFGISDNEAVRIDPQQRYVLECTHMALEDGGFTRKRLSGTKTGVFIGVMNDDYKTLVGTDHSEDNNFTATGLSTTVIASRVAYVYNLQGPCMTIDTACSSAMMALHLGCQAIRAGDCDIAICGGVSSILSPDMFIPLCKARMLSRVGQCQTFCDTADGYARGEGCGIVILQSTKKESRIEKIWGVLQTGINQDGRATSPMTAPSSEQQQNLLHAIYKKCKTDPRNLDYIEVHGTGTSVGDPTEVDAISTFIKSYPVNTQESNSSKKILMGSVKSNIGHTESAAAVAGLIKVLLMMKHKKIVRNLHIHENKSNINKKIKLDDTALDISVRVQNWPKNQMGNRIACVNSFGFGGSNGHAIIKQFSDRYSSDEEYSKVIKSESFLYFVCLFGRDRKSLSNNITSFITDVDTSSERPSDVSYTSIFCRDFFEHRSLLFGATLQDVCKHAKMKIESVGETMLGHKRNIVMVFCGVGTAWSGMGAEMMANHFVFRHTVRKIDQHLKMYSNLCVEEMLTCSSDCSDPVVNHIAIFTLQVALYELWKSLGVVPDTIIGQSVGEVAAAYASGALTLSSAVKVIYYRATILAQQTRGKMSVVGNIALSDIEKLCSKYHGSLNIAVYNSPSSCTVSGTETAIESLEEDVGKYSGSFIRSLKVPCAYHSHLMDECLSEILSKITDLEDGCESHIPQVSTVTCELSDPNELASSRYWAENIRQPVLFMQAVRKTVKVESTNVYLEIGPREVLKLHLPNIIKEESKFLSLPSMNRNDEKCLYRSLATLFELGVEIDFSTLMPSRGHLSPLPRYHFNKTTSLFISPSTKQYLSGFAKSRGTQHFVEKVTDEAFNVLINQDTTPWIFDHQLFGNITVPGATYVEAAITGACEVLEIPANAVELSASFENPCMIEKGKNTLLYMSFPKNTALGDRYLTYNVRLGERTLCTGIVRKRKTEECNKIDVVALKMHLTKQIKAEEIYGVLGKIGLKFGDSLRLIEDCHYTKGECLAVINLPPSVRHATRMFYLHPAVVDAMFQTTCVLSRELSEKSARSYEGIPIGFRSLITETAPKENMLVYTRLVRSTRINTFYKIVLCSLQGVIVAEIDDLVIRSMNATIPNDSISYEIKWRQLEQLPKMDQSERPLDSEPHLTVFGSKRLKCWLSLGTVSFNFIEIPNDPNSFKQQITEAILNSPKGRKVIFGPCINCHDLEYQNPKAIYEIILSNIISLQMIFKVRNSLLNDKFPVSIVTESTQQLSLQTSEKTNYLGAELWGFARSAMTEMPFEDIRLIDVVLGEENINPFILLVTHTERGPTESLIRNGRIHVSELHLSHTQDIEYIQTKQRGTLENLTVCSEDSKVVSKPFLTNTLRGHGHGISVTNDNLTDILVSRIVINRSHRIKSNSCLRTIALDHQASPDTRVKAIELIGWLKKDTYLENSKSIYGVCFPVTVSTVIAAPKCCIFLLKDIPFYKPGLISEVVLLWQISKQIKAKSNVLIVVSDTQCWRAKVLLEIFQYCMSSGAVVSWDDLADTATSREGFTHAVLVQFEKDLDIALLNTVTELQRVICVNRWLPWASMSVRLQSILCMKTVTLKVEDVMTTDCLIKLVPIVLKYLIKGTTDFKSILPKIIENVDLSYDSIDVQTAPLEINLPVFQYPSSLFKKDGHYIFVGGTSGLGWELLQYCAKLGAGNLYTLSRRGLSDEKAAQMKKIEKVNNCTIRHIQADITDSESMQSVFHTLKKNHVKVKGIFHGGGVLKDVLLDNMTTEHLETALKPKVLGTLNLYQVSKDMHLDFFVTHSSIVAIFGNPGQCNYAAGNSFQDSFAHFGVSRGHNTQSINWGALPFGMAKENVPDFEHRFRRQGIHVLNDSDVRSCFNEMILTKNIQKIFGIFDWKTFIENPMYSSSRNKFEPIFQHFGIMQKSPLLQSEEMNEITVDFVERSLEKQTECLTKIVLATLKDSLLAEIEILDLNSCIFQLGIDSMSAMSISNNLFQKTRVRVPLVFLLSNITTIKVLIDFIHEELTSRKETEETVNEETVHYDILDGSVSFMQASILNCLDIEKPANFIRTISYEMTSRRIGYREWTKIIIQLLQIHPGLRQIFEWNENTKMFQAKEIDIDELNVPVNIVPFKTIFDTAVEIHLDPRHQIPIMLHLSCKGRRTRMIVFLHAVVVDMQNINILFRDLELCARHHFSGGPNPVINNLDVTETIRQALALRFREMKAFWKQSLSRNIEPFSFSNSLSDILDETRWCEIGHVVSEEQLDDIVNFIRRETVTLYNFVLTVYFLLIYELTGLEVVPIITNTNMRGFVPALENVLTRCINEIPVIGMVKLDSSVGEYLRESAAMLNGMTEHGAYPFDLIKEEMSSDYLRQNIGRHRFIVDDISTASKRLATKDVSVKITAIRHRRHTYETCLFLYQDVTRKKLILDLGFNSEAVGKSFAKNMLERLVWLLLKIVHGNSSASVAEIFNEKSNYPEEPGESKGSTKTPYVWEQPTENSIGNTGTFSSKEYSTIDFDEFIQEKDFKETKIIMNGRLKKQSKNGHIYKTKVVLIRSNPPTSIQYYLCWKHLFTSRQVNVKDMTEINIKKIAGYYTLLMKKDQSWIQFFAKDLSEATIWFNKLKEVKEHIHVSNEERSTDL